MNFPTVWDRRSTASDLDGGEKRLICHLPESAWGRKWAAQKP